MTQPEHPEYVEAREEARRKARLPKMDRYTGRMAELQEQIETFIEPASMATSPLEKWVLGIVGIVGVVVCVGMGLLFLAYVSKILEMGPK